MALDIRGSLKNTRINGNYYVVIDELLSNAIDSYLIRKNSEPLLTGLEVKFLIEFFPRVLDGSKVELKITCTDNGAGFGDEQVKAFVTKDTSYKDDLAIEGIGKCKGSGRIQFFHYFTKIEIDSTSRVEGGIRRRKLSINDSVIKEIDEKSFLLEDAIDEQLQTIFTLDIIKPDIYEKFFNERDLREEFSAEAIKNYVMVNALQRFVSLKDSLGDFQIKFCTFQLSQGEIKQVEELSLTPNDLPQITETREINVYDDDADEMGEGDTQKFTISHYKLSKSAYKLKRNFVALCAKSSAVKVITSKYLKTKTLENNDIGGFYHIILVFSQV